MEKIRVAFFADVLEEDFDGVSVTLHQILNRVPKDYFEFLVITPHPPKNRKNVPFDIYVCNWIPIPVNKGYRLAIPRLDAGLKGRLNRFKPDLIHFSTPSLLGVYALKYGNKRNIPVVTIYHTHYATYVDYYIRVPKASSYLQEPVIKGLMGIYSKCALTFAPTEEMRDFLVNSGVPKESLRILKRGVEPLRFSPLKANGSFRKDYNLEGKRVILFVSRLVKEKETDTVVAVYNMFKETRDDVQFVITGDGPDKENMEAAMPDAIFTGKQTGDTLAEIYASSDVFIFPSVTETFGNVVLESLASGTPVVAAKAGGPVNIVENGKSGFLVTPKEQQEFYDRINEILEDDELRGRMSKAAVLYAKTQNWNRISQILFDGYHELIYKK
ncbi:MAG: glycosyltransferase family 1 protein [bacterium]|nr:glycosyltransferase family 1 protein [bacterium]